MHGPLNIKISLGVTDFYIFLSLFPFKQRILNFLIAFFKNPYSHLQIIPK